DAYTLNTAPINLKLQVQYQGCAESGFCYPPVTKWYNVSIANKQIQGLTQLPDAPALSDAPAVENAPTSKSLTSLENKSAFSIIASFYFLGILLTFT
ncbi:MAG TPA: protein-disulfide reductase DsbD family protein, partial [Candidatus Berkiella sp.]|nr:protein-disulfide reductase DsbD family protein [Candidatus Berkiella sp.]